MYRPGYPGQPASRPNMNSPYPVGGPPVYTQNTMTASSSYQRTNFPVTTGPIPGPVPGAHNPVPGPVPGAHNPGPYGGGHYQPNPNPNPMTFSSPVPSPYGTNFHQTGVGMGGMQGGMTGGGTPGGGMPGGGMPGGGMPGGGIPGGMPGGGMPGGGIPGGMPGGGMPGGIPGAMPGGGTPGGIPGGMPGGGIPGGMPGGGMPGGGMPGGNPQQYQQQQKPMPTTIQQLFERLSHEQYGEDKIKIIQASAGFIPTLTSQQLREVLKLCSFGFEDVVTALYPKLSDKPNFDVDLSGRPSLRSKLVGGTYSSELVVYSVYLPTSAPSSPSSNSQIPRQQSNINQGVGGLPPPPQIQPVQGKAQGPFHIVQGQGQGQGMTTSSMHPPPQQQFQGQGGQGGFGGGGLPPPPSRTSPRQQQQQQGSSGGITAATIDPTILAQAYSTLQKLQEEQKKLSEENQALQGTLKGMSGKAQEAKKLEQNISELEQERLRKEREKAELSSKLNEKDAMIASLQAQLHALTMVKEDEYKVDLIGRQLEELPTHGTIDYGWGSSAIDEAIGIGLQSKFSLDSMSADELSKLSLSDLLNLDELK